LLSRLADAATDAAIEADDLPVAAKARAEARAFAAAHQQLPPERRVPSLVDSGYLYPHWPPPWGRGAGTAEQVVIKQELAGIERFDHLGPSAWELPIILPTIIVHGTETQQEAWIRPTMLGDLTWCQLFSEPGAGSDLAAVATRAVAVEGGWEVTGQKVWTSTAQHARLGLALVRTGAAADRHRAITGMVVDMRSPGISIRPLRQITGEAEFNEVFLDAVFVPQADVVGDVGGGWTVARTALDFERGSAGGSDPRPDQLTSATVLSASQWDLCRRHWGWMRQRALDGYGNALDAVGRLVETDLALRALRRRAAARAGLGLRGGGEGSVIRLAMTTHVQRFAEIGHELVGSEGAFIDGDGEATRLLLHSRMATIAGGTSEIQRNLVAERVLGLPRDPKP
jgi:alkylation response protein AidB-like acyl-CoA dehydrogenase